MRYRGTSIALSHGTYLVVSMSLFYITLRTEICTHSDISVTNNDEICIIHRAIEVSLSLCDQGVSRNLYYQDTVPVSHVYHLDIQSPISMIDIYTTNLRV